MTVEWEPPDLSAHTIRVLEWTKLLEALASHARSSAGGARCLRLPLTSDLDEARRWQRETWEMSRLLESSDAVPVLSFPDIRDALARAQKGAVLDGLELRDHASVLALWEEVQASLQRHRHEAPVLASVAEPLQSVAALREIRTALDHAVHADGSIKESATPELRRLSQQANDLKQAMRHRLERILQSQQYDGILQERYFDQRQGRYVLPVKAEMENRVSGIVHDVSSSGATVFIEPRELVELNNAIKVADREVEREIRRILRELSASIATHAGPIAAGLETLVQLDAIAARASFGRQVGAHPVALNGEGHIMLEQARHPLLVLAKPEVVPNDLALDDRVRILVISGPNTGGKTVILKLLGLFAFMVRAGLLLPCAPGSEMAIFPRVYADIGDAQDLARDLSTFSAHMTQMIALLRETGEYRAQDPASRSGRALVLLDEPATSTDPTEGAALAQVLLCRLAGLGMTVVATTHYQSLKTLAQTTPGFANASVGFDIATLSPTYRLFMGVPGGSSALEIAGRLGMDRSILEEARRRLEREDRALEEMLEDLQSKQRQLSDDLARAVRARSEAEEAARAAKEQMARLAATEREERKGIKKKLQEQFSRAKAEVQATVEAVKREQRLVRANEAKQRLAELEAQTRAQLEPTGALVSLDRLQAGDQVEIAGLGMIGSLLEKPQGKKRVRVKVGEGEVLATVANLRGIAGADRPADRLSSPPQRQAPLIGSYHAEEQRIVDVRGQAADDALDRVVAALDRAAMAGVPLVRIIHGHGTGRLKGALREYLRDSPYVQSFRAGDRSEGGDGVTLVQLR